jgi:hypothetical protein
MSSFISAPTRSKLLANFHTKLGLNYENLS